MFHPLSSASGEKKRNKKKKETKKKDATSVAELLANWKLYYFLSLSLPHKHKLI